MAQLLQTIDLALGDYESQCYEAADRAPREWHRYWMDEAAAAHRTRMHMLRRVDEWLRYAKGRKVEVLCGECKERTHGNADT